MWPRLKKITILVSALGTFFFLLSHMQQFRKECPAHLPLLPCVIQVLFPDTPKIPIPDPTKTERQREVQEEAQNRVQESGQPQECDHLAANPNDPAKIVPGIKFGEIEPERAIAACEVAAARFPTIPRFKYQLARAYQRGSQANLAFSIFQDLAQQKYIAAYDNLGWLYLDNRVVSQDVKKALTIFKQGADANQPEAMTSLCKVYGNLRDFAEAKYWCERAAALGYEEAQEKLQKLREAPSSDAPFPLPFFLPSQEMPRTSRR